MKINFECELKEIVEAAIVCYEQCAKMEQAGQKGSVPVGQIASMIVERMVKECEQHGQ